jgi:hypothetical protein
MPGKAATPMGISAAQPVDRSGTAPYVSPPSVTRDRAQVAELVDALASGASGRKAVKVRVLSWAPLFFEGAVSISTGALVVSGVLFEVLLRLAGLETPANIEAGAPSQ